MTITQISRELRLDRKTVRRYATAASADELISEERAPRRMILDAYLPYSSLPARTPEAAKVEAAAPPLSRPVGGS
ncbi:hypothetical protein AB0O34_12840 [Sphaerisporangium sp. NPDC088356]|uniref:hypothetical protein n=1 Tax=Sphaerisporangium sp. NPDC088356 TaxID=3154871 RepID=UPI003432EDA2